jgi:hypothetical protein
MIKSQWGRKWSPMKRLSGICILLVLASACSPIKYESRLESGELIPIFKQNNLDASDPPENRRDVAEIEELDSSLYEPLAAKTLFLQSTAPTFDSREMKPRYWLLIEDYRSAELATKRMSEYRAVGTYDRIEKACQTQRTAYREGCDSFFLSKQSVRIWAVARGKRVYALTTDANLFTLIELPTNLRKAIAHLPKR